jgi:hypothetical protein
MSRAFPLIPCVPVSIDGYAIEHMYPSDPPSTALEQVAALAQEDYTAWSGPALAEQVRILSAVAERAEAALVAAVGAWDRMQAWATDGALSPAAWLAHRCGQPGDRAHRVVRTARLVDGTERLGKLLAEGEISADKADILARVAIPARRTLWERDSDVLLDVATNLAPADLRTVAAHWASCADDELDRGEPLAAYERRRLQASSNGTSGELHAYGPAADIEAILAMLDHHEPPDSGQGPEPVRTLAQRRYDAMAATAAMGLADDRGRIDPDHTLDVVVDYETFRRILEPSSAGTSNPAGGPFDPHRRCEVLDGSTVAPTTLQRLACDSWVSRLVFGPDGEVIDQGRRSRVFTPAQRRAIRIRDGGCVFPGCDRPPQWCDIHHLLPWNKDGPSDIDNGACVCRNHHTLIHEGGWRIWRDENGMWHAEPPPG